MSFAAEPYAQFVDNLLRGLTGGVVRTRFRFIDEERPFQLKPPGAILPSTLIVFGQAKGTYRQFALGRDFGLTADNSIDWRARADGSPAADAVWPDEGTDFFANYDHTGPSGGVPILSDRNPGSVVRMLAESFSVEMAVLSKQLENVYRAGFLETAEGRDLDQLTTLVGVTRRTRANAVGTVVFSRNSPATGDITIVAGTRVSTAEPPLATFQTVVDRVLRRGNLSVELEVRAEEAGPPGVVRANAITVLNQPVQGIDRIANPIATELGSDDERDDELRRRARRALEAAGRATAGALIGGLATLPGVRDKYVRIDEDHLARPGVVTLRVAAELDDATCARAIELIEQTRPVGVRVMHDLDRHSTLGPLEPSVDQVDDGLDDEPGALTVSGVFYPVVIAVKILPASAAISAQDRALLKAAGERAVHEVIADVGIGEPLIYNRLVAALMALDGVLDAQVEAYPWSASASAMAASTRRANLEPSKPLRPSLDVDHHGSLTVEIGGELIALDLEIEVTLAGAGLVGDTAANREEARIIVATDLRDGVSRLTQLSPGALLGLVGTSDNYAVTSLHYTAEFIQGGVRLASADPTIAVSTLERPWVRSVKLKPGGA